jgi:type IV pilus assembly protein PilY1
MRRNTRLNACETNSNKEHNMNMRGLKWIFVSFLLTASVVQAEDIDLFVGSNPPIAADNPNVIILIDNTSNWTANNQGWVGGNQGEAELNAIVTVVNSLAAPTADAPINLGIMLLTEKSGNTANEGAYVRSKVKPMTVANRAALTTLLLNLKANISDPSEKVNASLGFDQAMFEVFKYFGGYTSVANANNDVAGTPVSASRFGAKRYAKDDPKIDVTAFTDAGTRLNYSPVISPNAAPSCAGKNYVIVVGNGWVPAEKNGSTYIGETLLTNVGGSTTQAFAASSTDVRYADEMARFLFQTDVSAALGKQNVITYAIDVYKNAQSPELTALLKSMSQGVGGGAYFKATSAAEIVDSFASIFGAIQSQNSAFASVSLPVSVNTQGTFLNQVFVGMFRPDGSAKPRWFGNLKQYRLAFVGGVLKLVDSQATTPATSAISTSGSGFINECAVSYWTPGKNSTADGYWSNNTSANCPTYSATSNTPDGNVVEKGGQAYKLRAITPSVRNVKTCTVNASGGCLSSLTNFDASNILITRASLGLPTVALDSERIGLINWARGQNTDSEAIGVPANAAALTPVELIAKMRPSAHGDVVHSRPVAINFAASDSAPTQVVVYYGGNDGMLRAVNGNREGGIAIAGKQPGQELWSFVAPESYGMFTRLKNNTPVIKFPNGLSTSATPKTYGFDGPVTAYKTASSAWVYATMRRGGRMVYAFDVSTPGSPSLKWRVGCPSLLDDSNCTSGASGIGQTWAVPTILKSAGFVDGGGVNKPMLIMGGGYDACEDSDSPTAACKSSGKGHAIYLLDADTGALKQVFNTDGAVVGDITVLKDSAGLATYAYAADLGGNVYRISGAANAPIGSVAPGSWVMTKIAVLGGSGTAARKFLFGPDVVVEGDVHYVLLGSGDREKPLTFYSNAFAVQDYFFMLKDMPTNPTWLSAENATCSANNLCMDSLYSITSAATPAQSLIDAKKGWALRLTAKEKVVTSALTIFGTVYFSTHEPSEALTGSCTPNLGESRAYSINFRNAAGVNGVRSVDLVGDGLPPSPVAGLVTLDDGTTVPFCIGCSGASPLEGSEPPLPPTASQPKARVFWNIEQ